MCHAPSCVLQGNCFAGVTPVELWTHSMSCNTGNSECCASLPLDVAVEKTLVDETLKCHPAHLAQLMADHTQLDWRPVLQRIAMPCLNMIGCMSGVFPVAGCEAVSALITGTDQTTCLMMLLCTCSTVQTVLLCFLVPTHNAAAAFCLPHISGDSTRTSGQPRMDFENLGVS